MIVKIFTLTKGLEVFDNVIGIRVKSKDYNLLILKDYVSLLGEVHGSLEIELEDNSTIKYEGIDANFINDSNVFSVIIDEEKHD